MPVPELNPKEVFAAAKKNMPAIMRFFREQLKGSELYEGASQKINVEIEALLKTLEDLVSKKEKIDQEFQDSWSRTMKELETYHVFLNDVINEARDITGALNEDIHDVDAKKQQVSPEEKLVAIFFDLSNAVNHLVAKQEETSPKAVMLSDVGIKAAQSKHAIGGKIAAIAMMQSQVTGMDKTAQEADLKALKSSNPEEIECLKMKYELLLEFQDKIKELEGGSKKTGFASALFDGKRGSGKDSKKIQELQEAKKALAGQPVFDTKTFNLRLPELRKALSTGETVSKRGPTGFITKT